MNFSNMPDNTKAFVFETQNLFIFKTATNSVMANGNVLFAFPLLVSLLVFLAPTIALSTLPQSVGRQMG